MPRHPTLYHCLKTIIDIDPQLQKTVIDVGVQTLTRFLIDCLPNSHHYLIEPVKKYHPVIEKNYSEAGISFHLIDQPVAERSKEMYLHLLDMDQSGRITHSRLLESRCDLKNLKSVETIMSTTLDELFNPDCHGLDDYEYIVKMDVDGNEEKIISGGLKMLEKASFIILEASLGRADVIKRGALIERLGYRLFDICDNAYYYNQLALVDLVFINEEIRSQNLKFRPWDRSKGLWIQKYWKHGFREYESDELPNLGIQDNYIESD